MKIEVVSGKLSTVVQCKKCKTRMPLVIEVTPEELKQGKIKEEINKLKCRCKK